MKKMNNQNLWNFELCSQEGMNVPIWIAIGFEQRAVQNSQNLKTDNFCRLSVVSAQCVIATGNYADASMLSNYDDDDDDYSQAYSQIKEAFRVLAKDDIIQPYMSEDDFRYSNVRVLDVGYILYVFHIRHQQNFTAS